MGFFRYGNLIQGLILLFISLALYFFIIPWQTPSVEAKGILMSSTFFPKIGAGLFGFLASLLIVKNILSYRKIINARDIEVEPTQRGNLLAGVLACFVYALLINPLGFLIATFLVLILLMYFMGQRNFKLILPIAACFSALIFYIFYKVLSIPLPEGLLSF